MTAFLFIFFCIFKTEITNRGAYSMLNQFKKVFFFSFVIVSLIHAQFEIPKQLTHSAISEAKSNKASLFVPLNENESYFFWSERLSNPNEINLYYAHLSNDNWSTQRSVKLPFGSDSLMNLNSVVTNNNKVVLTYTDHDNPQLKVARLDSFLSTSTQIMREKLQIKGAVNGNLFYSKDENSVYITYSKIFNSNPSGIFYRKSLDNGATWENEFVVVDSQLNTAKNPSIIILDDKWLIAYQNQEDDIYLIESSDGITWSNPVEIISSDLELSNLKLVEESGKLFLFYEVAKNTPVENLTQSDVVYKISEDNGETWSEQFNFTNFYGNDIQFNVAKTNYKTGFSFASLREPDNSNYQIWYGFLNETKDTATNPYLYKYVFDVDSVNNKFNFSVYADDDNLEFVYLNYSKNLGDTVLVEMKDDGNSDNGDLVAGDNIFSFSLTRDIKEFDNLYFSFVVVDSSGNTANYRGLDSIFIPYQNQVVNIDVNRLKMPIDNKGILANDKINRENARYDDVVILFSAGFALSGLNNGKIWTNGVKSAALIEDYVPGKFGGLNNDPRNNIYVVKSDDEPFGVNWQYWTKAVELGAEFYDGDNDGVYDPVDKNSNGIWDPDEDKPVILGNITTWNVYNDSKPAEQRRYDNVPPQGIEVHQTVFASRGSNYEAMKNIIFIKYKIFNTGFVAEEHDSVYFSAWTDTDLGHPTDDLAGTDTLLKSMFTYNDEIDDSYGNYSGGYSDTPPALFTTFIQTPAEFVEGETFTDQNNNGVFDLGIDIPLDTAYYFDPTSNTKKEILGAKNVGLSGSVHWQSGEPPIQDPNNEIEDRYYMEGKTQEGRYLDPCNWNEVKGGVDCSSINPKFWYSGDPVTQTGWLNGYPSDQRQHVAVGPFTLEKNKPVELIVAYVVGRGSDNLNSITLAREYVKEAFNVYQNNFTNLPTSVGSDKNITPKEFVLNQNYPNPFNPSTAITYQLSAQSKVELKVFDILGREVSTLVNEIQNAGSYKVNFNASKLSSGIYIYQIKADNFVQSKKMMLLK